MIVGLLIFILKSEKYMKKLMMMVLALSIGFATTAQTRQDSTRKKTEKSKPVTKTRPTKGTQQSVIHRSAITEKKRFHPCKYKPGWIRAFLLLMLSYNFNAVCKALPTTSNIISLLMQNLHFLQANPNSFSFFS